MGGLGGGEGEAEVLKKYLFKVWYRLGRGGSAFFSGGEGGKGSKRKSEYCGKRQQQHQNLQEQKKKGGHLGNKAFLIGIFGHHGPKQKRKTP